MAENWQSSFRKRHKTVFTKAHEVKDLSPENVRVYVLIERVDEGTLYHWNSEMSQPGDAPWPPDINGLVPGKLKSMSPGEMEDEEERRARRSSRRTEAHTPVPSAGTATLLDDGLLDDEALVTFLDDASPERLAQKSPQRTTTTTNMYGQSIEGAESWYTADPGFDDLFGDMIQSEAFEDQSHLRQPPDDHRESSMARVDMANLELNDDCHVEVLSSSVNTGSKRCASSPLEAHHMPPEGQSDLNKGRQRKPSMLPLYRLASQKRTKSSSQLPGATSSRKIPRLVFPLSPLER